MVSRLFLVGLAAVAVPLASCSSSPVVPREVHVQVAVPCIDQARRPPRPPLRSLEQLLAMDQHRRTLATWTDRLQAEIYIGELEAVVEACARLGAP